MVANNIDFVYMTSLYNTCFFSAIMQDLFGDYLKLLLVYRNHIMYNTCS
jgi:hypothetical protein